MRRTAVPRDRLIDHLCDGDSAHPMTTELSSMLTGSSRFAAFADAHRRPAHDHSRHDLSRFREATAAAAA